MHDARTSVHLTYAFCSSFFGVLTNYEARTVLQTLNVSLSTLSPLALRRWHLCWQKQAQLLAMSAVCRLGFRSSSPELAGFLFADKAFRFLDDAVPPLLKRGIINREKERNSCICIWREISSYLLVLSLRNFLTDSKCILTAYPEPGM